MSARERFDASSNQQETVSGRAMSRWMYFAPVIALVAASAVIGLSLGRKAANPDEGAVIARIAALYVSEAAGAARPTDCAARPAASDVLWLVVTCGPPNGTGVYEYFIDPFGEVAHQNTP